MPHSAVSGGWSLGAKAVADTSNLLRLVENSAGKVMGLFGAATTDRSHLHFAVLHVSYHGLLLLANINI